MRKMIGILLALAGLAVSAIGQTTIFSDTAAGYSAGDLAGQNNWTPMQSYDTNGVLVVGSDQLGLNAFTVDNTSWIVNDAASDTAFLTTTNGSFVRLDEASAGNELFSEWTGTMDFNFSIPAGTYAGNGTMPNANFFVIGLSSVTNGALSEFSTNNLCMFLRYRANNRLDMQLHTEQDADLRIFQTPSDGTTWAEPLGKEVLGMNPQTGDCQSDELRLTWTIRKSVDGNYSAWGSVSNLSNGAWVDDIRTNGLGGKVVSTAGKNKSGGVYASSAPQLVMGRNDNAYSSLYGAFGNGLLDMDINALTVVKQIVAPALVVPTNVTAVAYDSQVTLSWDVSAEASSYKVMRSTTMGSGYTLATNVTGTTVVDAGLSNDTTYYYVIQADYGIHGVSANSAEVSATPVAIFTGSLLDTSFSSPDYSDADLAGQQGWLQVAGSSNNAFNVINSGTVTSAIDTVSTEASFSTNVGNAVYLDKLTDNVVNDAWDGYFDFQVSATGTNINNQQVFAFGVTSDNSAPLFLSGGANDQMALMSLLVRANGKIVAMAGSELNDTDSTRLAVLIGDTETGWNPDNGTSSDLVSDTIRYEWKIRKTTVADMYQVTATLSNTVSGTFGDMQTIVPYDTLTKATMYDSLSAHFTMGHYYKSRLTPSSDLVNITILDMAVNHSGGNLPQVTAPTGVTTLGGDRSVTVSWNPTFEATSFDVLFGETSNTVTEVVENTAAVSSLDQPRFNNVTGYYKVRANFDVGTADSLVVAGTPEATVSQINIDGLGSDSTLISGTINMDQTTGLQTNVGNAVTYIDYSSTEFVSTARYSNWNGPPMYGLSQVNTIEPDITSAKGSSGYRVRQGGTQVINGTQSDHFEFTTAGTQGEALWYVKSTDFIDPKASIDLTVDTHQVIIANQIFAGGGADKQRVAIQIDNSSTWYVSQTFQGNGTLTAPDQTTIANLYDDAWAPVTITPGTWFADPTTFSTNNNDSFTNVTAIGWFAVKVTKWKPYQLIYNTSGSIPSTEYWMNQYANVTNLTDDTDGDALINIKEYAFGGNPEDPNDQGTLPQMSQATLGGTNGLNYVHLELRDPAPGITYDLETTANLVVGPNVTNAYPVVGEENIDYFTKSVTNFIPADTAAKFIDLLVY